MIWTDIYGWKVKRRFKGIKNTGLNYPGEFQDIKELKD
jgi:hypothetical protein